MPTDLVTALAALPHGPEFRFVDSLTALNPGHSASALYHLPTNAPFLAGHFPDRPLMPGALMIEALAQVAGIAAQTHPELPPLDDLRLTAVRTIKILGSISPGEYLCIQTEIGGRLGSLVLATGKITTSDGTLLLEGQITLSGSLPVQSPDSKP